MYIGSIYRTRVCRSVHPMSSTPTPPRRLPRTDVTMVARSAPARPGRRAGRASRAGTLRHVRGLIDYALARRAVLRDFHRGRLGRSEVCDAHPELLRAARAIG